MAKSNPRKGKKQVFKLRAILLFTFIRLPHSSNAKCASDKTQLIDSGHKTSFRRVLFQSGCISTNYINFLKSWKQVA